MKRAAKPYSSGRHEDADYQDPHRAIALRVIADAKADWRRCQAGRVTSASIGSRWALTPERMLLEASTMRWELSQWFKDPDGLEFWCDVAGESIEAVRQAVGA